jgi:hypothetical protein
MLSFVSCFSRIAAVFPAEAVLTFAALVARNKNMDSGEGPSAATWRGYDKIQAILPSPYIRRLSAIGSTDTQTSPVPVLMPQTPYPTTLRS